MLRAHWQSAFLPLDTDGVLTLLGEGGVIDHEDPGGVGERLGDDGAVAPPDRLLVPGALADELLQRLNVSKRASDRLSGRLQAPERCREESHPNSLFQV